MLAFATCLHVNGLLSRRDVLQGLRLQLSVSAKSQIVLALMSEFKATHLLQTACGMISPNSSIAVTLRRIAAKGFNSLSRNSGRASIHAALHSSRVHRSQWGFATRPMSLVASLRCFGAPATFNTCRGSDNVCHD